MDHGRKSFLNFIWITLNLMTFAILFLNMLIFQLAKITLQWNPSCEATHFVPKMLRKGDLSLGKIQYIYVMIYIDQ